MFRTDPVDRFCRRRRRRRIRGPGRSEECVPLVAAISIYRARAHTHAHDRPLTLTYAHRHNNGQRRGSVIRGRTILLFFFLCLPPPPPTPHPPYPSSTPFRTTLDRRPRPSLCARSPSRGRVPTGFYPTVSRIRDPTRITSQVLIIAPRDRDGRATRQRVSRTSERGLSSYDGPVFPLIGCRFFFFFSSLAVTGRGLGRKIVRPRAPKGSESIVRDFYRARRLKTRTRPTMSPKLI